jgi:hypothetical protein
MLLFFNDSVIISVSKFIKLELPANDNSANPALPTNVHNIYRYGLSIEDDDFPSGLLTLY